ncbi:MAG: hypothetical protein ABIH89_03730 [Elusimicrobiota bacterium]
MDSKIRLTDMQNDAFKEYGNICAGNSATVYTQMFEQDIKVIISSTDLLKISDIKSLNKDITVLYFRVFGDAAGYVVINMTNSAALSLVSMFTEDGTAAGRLSASGETQLKEIGNILATAYMHVVSKMTLNRLILAMPRLATGTLGSILDIINIDTQDPELPVVDIAWKIKKTDIVVNGDMYIFPDKMLKAALLDVSSAKE